MPKSYPTSIRMTDEMKGDLKRIAAWRQWPVATTVTRALREWCDFQIEQMKQVKAKKK